MSNTCFRFLAKCQKFNLKKKLWCWHWIFSPHGEKKRKSIIKFNRNLIKFNIEKHYAVLEQRTSYKVYFQTPRESRAPSHLDRDALTSESAGMPEVSFSSDTCFNKTLKPKIGWFLPKTPQRTTVEIFLFRLDFIPLMLFFSK